jgi:hypothetical protein
VKYDSCFLENHMQNIFTSCGQSESGLCGDISHRQGSNQILLSIDLVYNVTEILEVKLRITMCHRVFFSYVHCAMCTEVSSNLRT